MAIETVTAPARLVAGHAVRTSNAAEMDPARARLPELWRRVAAAAAGDLVAVLTDYESDRDGEYTQLVGREVAAVEDLRVGELAVRLDAGSYAVFETTGEPPDSIVDGWRRVWAAEDAGRLRRAWTADFELWPAGGSPTIFVAVER